MIKIVPITKVEKYKFIPDTPEDKKLLDEAMVKVRESALVDNWYYLMTPTKMHRVVLDYLYNKTEVSLQLEP